MSENWTELKIKVPAPQADLAGAIANMVVPYGIYIEDYSDLEEVAPQGAHIDLIDEELLARGGVYGMGGRRALRQRFSALEFS